MDSCWVALQNLEEITKKFQRCTLEKLSMDQLFWECESNMITRRVYIHNTKIFTYLEQNVPMNQFFGSSKIKCLPGGFIHRKQKFFVIFAQTKPY